MLRGQQTECSHKIITATKCTCNIYHILPNTWDNKTVENTSDDSVNDIVQHGEISTRLHYLYNNVINNKYVAKRHKTNEISKIAKIRAKKDTQIN